MIVNGTPFSWASKIELMLDFAMSVRARGDGDSRLPTRWCSSR